MNIQTRHKTMLDHLMPMHLVFGPTSHIQHAGPTLRKLHPNAPLNGQRLLEVFEVMRPKNIVSLGDLFEFTGMKLHLRFRAAPHTQFKAVVAPYDDKSGGVLNLSFGIGVVDAVQNFGLTNADFAPNDLIIEMLYLVEAKSAAMEESHKLNSRLHAARLVAEEKAFSDALTGLRNRRALEQVMDVFLEQDVPFTLIHLDLDHFKAVNDTLGHGAGDAVLREVARILEAETRSDDVVARTGGDEFVLVLRNCVPAPKLEEIANRIIAHLEVPVMHEGHECKISGSMGSVQTKQRPMPRQ